MTSITPDPRFRTYYYVWLAIIMAILLVLVVLPLALFAPSAVAAGAGVLWCALAAFVAVWISLFYDTIHYELTSTEVTWERGVWFRQTGIVPYNRITNVDIIQGPLMRIFSISALRIQTAGYSAQATAEIRLQGIEQPVKLRDTIMGYVRGGPAVSAATGGSEEIPARDTLLEEVRAIRVLLEMMAGKKE
ncbi:MAG: PH domain-containing protein [Methanomicrobiales archaeon]